MPQYEFVAVDFDGTLCTSNFPDIGEPNELVIDYVKRLAAEGSKIILWTSRENGTRKLLDEAVNFCEEHGISLYAVNENPDNPHKSPEYPEGRKIFANLYIDDRALNPAQIEPESVYGQQAADNWAWERAVSIARNRGFIIGGRG